MHNVLSLTLCLALVGCQTQGYQQYADAMARIAESKASVAREQMQMMMRIAEHSTDSGTRMMAVAMIGMSANGGGGGQQYVNPQPPVNEALQWAQVLIPSLVPVALGLWNYKSTKHQTDATANTTIAGYEAMTNIAQAGFSVAGSNTTTNTTSTSTVSTTNTNQIGGPGVIGGGSVVLNPLPPAPAPLPFVP